MSQEFSNTDKMFGDTYWKSVEAGEEPLQTGPDFGVEITEDYIHPENPQFCQTCPFNQGCTEGPVVGGSPAFGSGMEGEYVDFKWRDARRSETPTISVYYNTYDGGIGSDEVRYTWEWTSAAMHECASPIASSERSIASLGLKRIIPRCGVFYERNDEGQVVKKPGVHFNK